MTSRPQPPQPEDVSQHRPDAGHGLGPRNLELDCSLTNRDAMTPAPPQEPPLVDLGQLLVRHAGRNHGGPKPARLVQHHTGVGTAPKLLDVVDEPVEQLVADPLAFVAAHHARLTRPPPPKRPGLRPRRERGLPPAVGRSQPLGVRPLVALGQGWRRGVAENLSGNAPPRRPRLEPRVFAEEGGHTGAHVEALRNRVRGLPSPRRRSPRRPIWYNLGFFHWGRARGQPTYKRTSACVRTYARPHLSVCTYVRTYVRVTRPDALRTCVRMYAVYTYADVCVRMASPRFCARPRPDAQN